MSSASSCQQHLTSTDMTMLSRVLKEVCAKNDMQNDSVDLQRLAALLIREFQSGVTREHDLLTAFTGDGHLKLSVPLNELANFMGGGLNRWPSNGKAGLGATRPAGGAL